jgi:hypothetical protein
MGATETVTAERDTTTSDDSFDIWIEVRYVGGTGCGTWSLTIEGRDC